MAYNQSVPMYYGAKRRLFQFAKEMRLAPTKAEQKMWQILNAEPFLKYKFRRQHPISKFIADFYSHQLKLVIEIDGSIHEVQEQKEYDIFRDDEMDAYEIVVLRITNTEVLEKTASAIQKIKIQINKCELRKAED
jgi:cyclase